MVGTLPNLERLEDLHLIFDRFSHSIRTPLSVSMGVVNDLCSGYSLETKDLEDARISLDAILNALNSFRDVTQPPDFRPSPQSLQNFLEMNMESSFGIPSETLNCTLHLDLGERSLQRPLDHQLLLRSLRYLLLYAVSRLNQFSEVPHSLGIPREITLSLSLNQTHEIFSLSIPQPLTSDLSLLKTLPSWRSLILCDHSLASLGLLFSDTVFSLHGASTKINVLESSGRPTCLIFCGLFPLC